MPARVLKVHPADNVIVALRNLPAGDQIDFDGQRYELPYAVEAKHKFVTEDRQTGDTITMYGVRVGKATQPIRRGEPITTFNLRHDADRYSLDKKQPYSWQPPDVSAWKDRTFMGYHRVDGRVGTRNYWLVVPLVFCENRNILTLKDAFERELGYAQTDVYREQVRELLHLYQAGDLRTITKMEPFVDPLQLRTLSHPPVSRPFKNVDGIKFLTHEMGCGGT
ncbi:MAG: UxaA family hydrolase, partial [Bacteroidetes bacterium]|nr:UxaA family hydrolase [Fibrella sp.]